MKNKMKWVYMLVGGFLAVGLIAGAGFAFLTSEAAGRFSPSTQGATPYFGWLSDGDHPMGKYEEALAEALGITVEELQGAHQAVFQAQIEAAVASGDLTEEQAEQILERDGFGPHGRRGSGERAGEMSALLAAELGISVSTLEAAQQEAREQLMAEALENGDISQEQYELMQSHQALAPYLQEAMAEASTFVLNGFELSTDVDIIYYPNRYSDKRGKAMWNTVRDILDGQTCFKIN